MFNIVEDIGIMNFSCFRPEERSTGAASLSSGFFYDFSLCRSRAWISRGWLLYQLIVTLDARSPRDPETTSKSRHAGTPTQIMKTKPKVIRRPGTLLPTGIWCIDMPGW